MTQPLFLDVKHLNSPLYKSGELCYNTLEDKERGSEQ